MAKHMVRVPFATRARRLFCKTWLRAEDGHDAVTAAAANAQSSGSFRVVDDMDEAFAGVLLVASLDTDRCPAADMVAKVGAVKD